MKKSRLFIIIFILLTGYITFGQTNSISELYNKISELEKRIRALELIINANPFNNNIDNSNIISNNILNWRKLKVGMKDEEVRNVLGEPLHIRRYTPNYYIWEYSENSIHSNISFNDRGVSGWVEPE